MRYKDLKIGKKLQANQLAASASNVASRGGSVQRRILCRAANHQSRKRWQISKSPI